MNFWPGRIALITVDAAAIREAEHRVESCEYCHADDAEILFDLILAEVLGKRGPFEFILSETARCPNCKQPLYEKTRVEPKR